MRVGRRWRLLFEAIARALRLTRGRGRLEVNFEDGRLRDVVLQTRLGVPELEELGDRELDQVVDEVR